MQLLGVSPTPRWQYVSVQQPQPQYVQYVVQQVHFHAPILTHQSFLRWEHPDRGGQ
jgi:hypothetical protein